MVKIEQSLRECTGAVNIVTSEVSANEVLPNPQKIIVVPSIGTIFLEESSNVKLNINDVCNLIRTLKGRSTRAF